MINILERIRNNLIVSCQVDGFGDPALSAAFISDMAEAAIAGGAKGLRVNSPEHVAAVRKITDLPIIGLTKAQKLGATRITPTLESVQALSDAGADIIAIGCSDAIWAGDEPWEDVLRQAVSGLDILILADIATLHEAERAVKLGAHCIAPTIRGYTPDTSDITQFDFEFLRTIVASSSVPVLAEGRVDTPDEAARAIRIGAHSVIVGTSITRPTVITGRFVKAIAAQTSPRHSVGIDIGGTTIKGVIIDGTGVIVEHARVPTPITGKDIPAVVCKLATELLTKEYNFEPAIGVATAGVVDPNTGSIRSATGNIPGWAGTPLEKIVRQELGIHAVVLNDAQAAAFAEAKIGSASDLFTFVMLTIGTGLGGGVFVDGRLLKGHLGRAGSIGHMTLRREGRACNCGRVGCAETYISSLALQKNYATVLSSAELVDAGTIHKLALAGDPEALKAYDQLFDDLADCISSLANAFDPEAFVITGGLIENIDGIREKIARRIETQSPTLGSVPTDLRFAKEGPFTGALGAALYAKNSLAL